MVTPTTLDEIVSIIVNANGPVLFNKSDQPHPFDVGVTDKPNSTSISLSAYTGIIEYDVSDQVVVVRAGTSVPELQAALGQEGQCLPFPLLNPVQTTSSALTHGALIDEIAYNLPHGLSAQHGSWRDWVLGMRLIKPDGTIVKCGSKAVKNVAGFDVQKLMIGARNSLALVAEVTLRTFPLGALTQTEMQFAPAKLGNSPNWIHRVLPKDFDTAVAAHARNLIAADRPSSTLWAEVSPEGLLRRFPGDWILRAGCGTRNLVFSDPTVVRLMTRTKDLFDPTHKFNPGVMGIF